MFHSFFELYIKRYQHQVFYERETRTKKTRVVEENSVRRKGNSDLINIKQRVIGLWCKC